MPYAKLKLRGIFVSIIFLLPILTMFLAEFINSFAGEILGKFFSSCNYKGGGGSLNLCYNDQFMLSSLTALVLAYLVILGCQQFLKKKIAWGESLAALAYLVLTPIITINLYLYVVEGLDLWGKARGAFNDWFMPSLILFHASLLILFSVKLELPPRSLHSPSIPKPLSARTRKKRV